MLDATPPTPAADPEPYADRVSLHGGRMVMIRKVQAFRAYRLTDPSPGADLDRIRRQHDATLRRVRDCRIRLWAAYAAMARAGFRDLARHLQAEIGRLTERARREGRQAAIREAALAHEIDLSRRLRTAGRGWDQHSHRPGGN